MKEHKTAVLITLLVVVYYLHAASDSQLKDNQEDIIQKIEYRAEVQNNFTAKDNPQTSEKALLMINAGSVLPRYIFIKSVDNDNRIKTSGLKNIRLDPGSYNVRFEQWGFYMHDTSFSLQQGETKIVNISPQLINSDSIKKHRFWLFQQRTSVPIAIFSLYSAYWLKETAQYVYKQYLDETNPNLVSKYRKRSDKLLDYSYIAISVNITSDMWVIYSFFKREYWYRQVKHEMANPTSVNK